MSTTMVCNTNSQTENQTGRLQQKPNSTEKPKHRPKSLQLAPFDPSELSRRLSVVQGTDDEVDPMNQSAVTPRTKNFSYNIGKGRQSSGSVNGPLSPRTVGSKEPSPKDTGFAPKLVLPKEQSPKDASFSPKASNSRKSSTAEPSPRRGSRRESLKEMFAWRGTNYDAKDEEATAAAPTPAYRHVPKVAAAQFARTTTVETVSQKAAQVPKTPTVPRPAPGPGAMSNGVISPQDYNKMYRRAQSLCSGRPYERNGQFQLTILETTAEVDEEPVQHNPRHTFQAHLWNRSFEMGSEHARRMSTGNIQSRQHMEMTGSTPQLRRDLSSLSMSQVRRDSVNSQLRRDSVNSHRRDSVSSQIRRDSGGSSGTPSRRESLPASPFRQEFDPMAHLRRESDPATPSSRRGSVTSQQTAQLVAAHRNVDWSQSDEPAKPVKPSSNHVVQKKANGNTNINSITNTNTTTPTHTSTITSTNTNTNTNGKWSLKGRLGKGSRSLDQGRKEDPPQVEGVSNAPPSKSTRPSLLSRLKRQSA